MSGGARVKTVRRGAGARSHAALLQRRDPREGCVVAVGVEHDEPMADGARCDRESSPERIVRPRLPCTCSPCREWAGAGFVDDQHPKNGHHRRMASRSFAPLALCSVLLALIGCAESPGRLIVLVESDMPDLIHVEVSTARLAGGGVDTRGFPIGSAAGDNRFPFSFVLEPNGHPQDGVEIRVEGYALRPTGESLVVSRTVRTGFVAGTTRLVRIALKGICSGQLCVAGVTTCQEGTCVTIPVLRPETLRVLSRMGAEFDDAGVVDASVLDMSMDARADGARDLDVPDLDGGWDLGAPDLDAAGPDDAGVDAPMSDAGSCTPTMEICDGLDNNCNVTIDDGATCPTGPIGAVCSDGTCGCPGLQTNCAGTCNFTGAPCVGGDVACGGGAGTTVCSGTGTACNPTPRTSGDCTCAAPTEFDCACTSSGACALAYVELCLDADYGTCTRITASGGITDLSALGLSRNISSVRVRNVAHVELWVNTGFTGDQIRLTADCANMASCGGLVGDNQARSAFVQR